MSDTTRSLPSDADVAFRNTVRDMIFSGSRVEGRKDDSWEILGYTTGLYNPLRRIVSNPLRPLPIVSALARFVWMMAGNDRLEDIAFYEPKVSGYTDDGLVVPGSSYGHRIFNSSPGLNQLEGVIKSLEADSTSRQACVVIWDAQDAVRSSADIPCTFGASFHIRNNGLTMQLMMRSNNAFRLLPFNLFEFSMLGEVVAATLGVPFKAYVHTAMSMHVYENEHEWQTTMAVANSNPLATPSFTMEPMPTGDAYTQCRKVAQLEAKLRHVCTFGDMEKVVSEANRELNPYWLNLFQVLVAYVAAKHHWGWRGWLTGNPYQNMAIADISKKLGLAYAVAEHKVPTGLAASTARANAAEADESGT